MKQKKITIFFLHVLMITQTYFFLPLVPLYAREAGLSAFLIGQAIFFYSLPSGFTKIIIGYFIDKLSCKSVLIFANLIFGLGFIFYFFPENFYLLFLGQFLTGMARASFMAATSVYFSEMDSGSRGTNLGIRTAGIGLGFFIGPLLGGLVSDQWGFQILFIVLLVTLLLNGLLLYLLPDIRKNKKSVLAKKSSVRLTSKIKYLFSNPNFLIVVLSGITIAGILAIIDNYLPIYLDHLNLPVKLLGIIMSIKGISQILFGPIVGKLSDKMGRFPFIYFGIIIGSTGIFLLPFISNFWLIIVLVFLTSMGFTVLNPISNALAGETVEPEDRGLAIGFWQSTVSFCTTIFTQVFSFLYSNYPINWIFITAALTLATSLIGIIILHKKSAQMLFERTGSV